LIVNECVGPAVFVTDKSIPVATYAALQCCSIMEFPVKEATTGIAPITPPMIGPFEL